jgi:hypothetical protein
LYQSYPDKNNQSNRKGQTLILNESFLDWAMEERKNCALSLSAEEYSRFCQADVFITNSEFGIIIFDLTGLELIVNIFLWVNCDSKEELDEVRYRLRLKLSNVKQLKSMIQEYEEVEEYEKCSEIKKEISKKIR